MHFIIQQQQQLLLPLLLLLLLLLVHLHYYYYWSVTTYQRHVVGLWWAQQPAGRHPNTNSSVELHQVRHSQRDERHAQRGRKDRVRIAARIGGSTPSRLHVTRQCCQNTTSRHCRRRFQLNASLPTLLRRSVQLHALTLSFSSSSCCS